MVAKRTFNEEFKLEAVKLVEERGVSIAQASRDLGIHVNVLRGWIKKLSALLRDAKGGPNASERAEIQQLRRENARLKAERDLLKKATALFAKESL